MTCFRNKIQTEVSVYPTCLSISLAFATPQLIMDHLLAQPCTRLPKKEICADVSHCIAQNTFSPLCLRHHSFSAWLSGPRETNEKRTKLSPSSVKPAETAQLWFSWVGSKVKVHSPENGTATAARIRIRDRQLNVSDERPPPLCFPQQEGEEPTRAGPRRAIQKVPVKEQLQAFSLTRLPAQMAMH